MRMPGPAAEQRPPQGTTSAGHDVDVHGRYTTDADSTRVHPQDSLKDEALSVVIYMFRC